MFLRIFFILIVFMRQVKDRGSMKIVVLDGYTENPGDLSWEALAALGDLTVYDYTAPAETAARSQDTEILITNKTVLSGELIAALPKLRYIGLLSTGYNVVDIAAAKARQIPVCNIPTYGTESVAQMVFALLLELTNQVGLHSESVKAGEWSASRDFSYWKTPLLELAGKTMGFVGFGKIGQRAADIAQAFGMSVIAYDLYPQPQERPRFRYGTLDEVLAAADVLSLNCALTPENTGFLNRENIAKMKTGAMVINTSRGPLINEADLAEALNSGKLAGAALDVLEVEPPKKDNPLLTAKNIIVTPHIAWATFEARQRLMDIAVANVAAFIEGNPCNVVNG